MSIDTAIRERLAAPSRPIMDKATKDEDTKIKAVHCLGFCFQGYKGMDTCGKCRGTGSQLVIPNGKRFPNTKRGYDDALKALRTDWHPVAELPEGEG